MLSRSEYWWFHTRRHVMQIDRSINNTTLTYTHMHACMCMEGECLTSLTDLVGCKRDGPTRLMFGFYYAEWQRRASEMSNLLHAGIPRMKTSKRVCQSTLKHNLNMGHVMCTPPAQNGWGESGIKRQYGPRDFESSSNNLQLTFTESASNCTSQTWVRQEKP